MVFEPLAGNAGQGPAQDGLDFEVIQEWSMSISGTPRKLAGHGPLNTTSRVLVYACPRRRGGCWSGWDT